MATTYRRTVVDLDGFLVASLAKPLAVPLAYSGELAGRHGRIPFNRNLRELRQERGVQSKDIAPDLGEFKISEFPNPRDSCAMTPAVLDPPSSRSRTEYLERGVRAKPPAVDPISAL